MESLNGVVAFQHKGSIAWAVDACPFVTLGVCATDGDIFQIYDSTVGNGNLVVAAQLAGEGFEVLRRVVAGKSRKIGRFSGCRQRCCCWRRNLHRIHQNRIHHNRIHQNRIHRNRTNRNRTITHFLHRQVIRAILHAAQDKPSLTGNLADDGTCVQQGVGAYEHLHGEFLVRSEDLRQLRAVGPPRNTRRCSIDALRAALDAVAVDGVGGCQADTRPFNGIACASRAEGDAASDQTASL